MMNENIITDWYRKKADRISRVDGIKIEALANKSVAVYIHDDKMNYYSNQVMVLVSVILLSKWCTRIHIIASNDIRLIVPAYHDKSMIEVIEELVRSNDEEILIQFHEKIDADYNIILSIGGNALREVSDNIWIDADGWIAGAGSNSVSFPLANKTSALNPVGSVFAACLGQTLIFEKLLGLCSGSSFSKWVSLFDYQTHDDNAHFLSNPIIPDQIDLGKIFQIGCGAVGSSFDFIVSLTHFKGEITLIDFDSVEVENIVSSLTFKKADATGSEKKVNVCKNTLKHSNVSTISFDGDYSAFIAKNKMSENYPDLILCFANEYNIWSTVQNNYPPIVLHATTTSNWGMNFGRHLPEKEWCIVCRFGVEVSEVIPVCAKGVVGKTEAENEILGVLPFLSPAAGVITLAELIKLNLSVQQQGENFLQLQLKSISSLQIKQQQRGKREDCQVCKDQYRELYHNYLPKSKYHLIE